MTIDSKKEAIIQYISVHPGVISANIRIGLGRASIGAHLRSLMKAGMIVQDGSNGWHLATGYVVHKRPKALTPIDIAAEYIRKMIDLK